MPGGELEYAVLVAVWELGSASAREVHDRVGRPAGLVYTTIAKVLDRLYGKRLVAREPEGRAFRYRPAVARKTVEKARVRDSMSRLLGADPQPAIAALVTELESLDPRLVDELARQVAAHRKARRGT
jgi:predicted transcriptional regulator